MTTPTIPEGYTKGSKQKIKWECKLGHEWEATINSRIVVGTGCPVCANRQVLPGFNDLATTHPQLRFKLKSTDPTTVYAGSSQKVEWVCSENHTFTKSLAVVTGNEAPCPVCSGKEVLIGYNDLATTHPDLSTQLVDVDPKTITAHKEQRVGWKCDQGHEWETTVASRALLGRRCPYCTGRLAIKGENDLATTHPELASQLLETDPTTIKAGSNKKLKWKCDQGHEWSAVVGRRTASKSGCPYCAGQRVVSGVNDFETVNPDLMKYWDYGENTLKPSESFSRSDTPLHFVCEVGHKFTRSAFSMSRSSVCTICTNHVLKVGYNDLGTLFPDIATQLITADPTTILAGSGTKMSWECSRGHQWEISPYRRTKEGTGCPQCYPLNFVSKAENKIFEHLKGLGLNVIQSERKVLSGTELDMYFPDLKIAIEYNGLYWHSSAHKTRTYHQEKTQACFELGIKLIHVWEDDYARNPELVHRMLEHKLGVSTQKKIPARKTVVRQISTDEARTFLNENHIQGFAGGSIRLGLFSKDTDQLVAVTTLRRDEDVLTLERFATSAIIPGGQSKFLKYIDRNFEYTKMITFADLTVSGGSLYETTGWVKDGELAPDYRYVYKGVREHKFNFRKKRFEKDPQLKFESDLTERQLAELNGIPRIYDAGKIRYVRYRDIINKDVIQTTDRIS